MQIHVTINGVKYGPYQIDQINKYMSDGRIDPSHALAWYEGCQDWIPLRQVPGVIQPTGAPPPPPPPYVGANEIPAGDKSPMFGSTKNNAHDQQSLKPRKIGLAVKLLWIGIGIGVLQFLIFLVQNDDSSSSASAIAMAILSLSVVSFLVVMIDRQRNWARIAFTILLILGIPGVLRQFFFFLEHSPLIGLLVLMQMAAQTFAAVVLWKNEANSWFKSRSVS
jgi:hypothetical protein